MSYDKNVTQRGQAYLANLPYFECNPTKSEAVGEPRQIEAVKEDRARIDGYYTLIEDPKPSSANRRLLQSRLVVNDPMVTVAAEEGVNNYRSVGHSCEHSLQLLPRVASGDQCDQQSVQHPVYPI